MSGGSADVKETRKRIENATTGGVERFSKSLARGNLEDTNREEGAIVTPWRANDAGEGI